MVQYNEHGALREEMDVVVSLLSQPFFSWDDEWKKTIVERGPPQFVVRLYGPLSSTTFQLSLYRRFKWLCSSVIKQQLFCWPCVLFCPRDAPLNVTVCNHSTSVIELCENHSRQRNHLSAHIALSHFTKVSANGRDSIAALGESEVDKNRYIVQNVFEVAIALCRKKSLLRDSEETTVEIEFQNDFHKALKEGEKLDRCWTYSEYYGETTDTLFHEVINCLGNGIRLAITEYLNQVPFYVCTVGKFAVPSGEMRFAVSLRCVTPKCDVREYFWGFYEVDVDPSEAFFVVLKKAFNNADVCRKIIGFTYKGFNVCINSEVLVNVRNRIRDVAPNAWLIHSYHPHLNVVLQTNCSQSKPVNIFFSVLQGIPAFFHDYEELQVFLDEIPDLKSALSIDDNDWTACHTIVSTVHRFRPKLIDIFQNLIKSHDASVARESQMLHDNLSDSNFTFLLSVFSEIFCKTSSLHSTLSLNNYSEPGFSFKAISNCIASVVDMLNEETFTRFTQEAARASCTRGLINVQVSQISLYPFKSNREMYFEIVNNVWKQLGAMLELCDEWEILKHFDIGKYCAADRRINCESVDGLLEMYGSYFIRDKLQNELFTIFSPEHCDKYQFFNLRTLMVAVVEAGTDEILTETCKMIQLLTLVKASIHSQEETSAWTSQWRVQLDNSTVQNTSNLALISIHRDILDDIVERPSSREELIDRFMGKNEENEDDASLSSPTSYFEMCPIAETSSVIPSTSRSTMLALNSERPSTFEVNSSSIQPPTSNAYLDLSKTVPAPRVKMVRQLVSNQCRHVPRILRRKQSAPSEIPSTSNTRPPP